MTLKDRIMSVYHNEKPDKVPITIYDRYLPRGASERRLRDMGVGIVKYYPVVSMLAPPWHFLPGYVSEVKNVSLNVQYLWNNGRPTERRIYNTPVGKVWQDSEKDPGGAGSEHITKHYITDIEDYKIVQFIIENTCMISQAKDINLLIDDLGDDGVVFGRIDRSPYQKCLIELAGPEQFLIDLHTEPEPVLSLLNSLKNKMVQSIETVLEAKPDVFWAPENVTCDMTPPGAYKEYCMPMYETFGNEIAKTGIPYMVHIDGKMKPLAELINLSRFDIIESLSYPEIGGDCTLKEAYAAFPNKVVVPNYPTNLCRMSDEEIKSRTRDIISDAGDKPFLFSFSEDIPVSHWKRLIGLVAGVINE